MRQYDVWVEGFSVTGNSQGAHLVGSAEAPSFRDAVKIVTDKAGLKVDFTPETGMTIWGCKLFDNEQQARKSYG